MDNGSLKIKCPYCNKPAEWVENKEIYGTNIGDSYMIYLCRGCDAYVGCHQNTTNPLGTLANKDLRMLRQQVHNKIDAYWKSGKIKRDLLYELISEEFGNEFHVGWAREVHCRWALDELDINKLLKQLN